MIKNSLILALPVILAACGGSTDTVQNPFTNTSSGGGAGYTGPAPRDEDVNDFMNTVWVGLKSELRCGQCHDSDGQASDYPFVNDLDVNAAFDFVQSRNLVNLNDPAGSRLVTKVSNDLHGCWQPGFESVCAETIENMITNWAGDFDNTTARAIQLEAPAIKDIENSKNYPDTATTDPDPNDATDTSFAETVYPLLTQHCDSCHYEEGASQQQQPFFANPVDVDSSYEAAKTKINIDTPANSRFVDRLLDGHQCWTGPSPMECAQDAEDMRLAIADFAGSINPVQINPLLVTSKALLLLEDGIVASGGNRHEADTIALYEFKAGTGDKAFDTSGVGEAMDLTLTSGVSWLGAYGLDFTGGKAQANIGSSQKLYDLIQISQEYSIEAWTIPANVTQEDTSIIGYDVGPSQKNFALTQTLYNYNFSNRSDQSDAKGDAFISSEDAGEILQSSLQHVVVTYSNVNGRQIYVNGELLDVDDPVSGSTSIANWDPTFAFVLGQNANNGQGWEGKLRMVAIHNRVLTPEQVMQNFEVGVGQKYFLLFSVSEELAGTIPSCLPDVDTHNCFIKMEVSQFDNYGYLFLEPTFINLDSSWVPTGDITIKNIRIGINGKEAVSGQSFANMEVNVNSAEYTSAEGQLLSRKGAVIALEKGAADDIFFLTFEVLANNTFNYVDISPIPPVLSNADPVSDIGVRTFDEINETIARMTGIPVTNAAVNGVFQQYRQQLPAIEDLDAFLSSHQMAIAQLALTSCSERVEYDSNSSNTPVMFTNFDFSQSAEVAFDDQAERDNAIDPVLTAVLSSGLGTQPDAADVKGSLGDISVQQTLDWGDGTGDYDSLITEMLKCPLPDDPHFKEDPNNPGQALFPCNINNDINTVGRTKEIVKAICAAAVGSAAMLIQ